ERAIDFISAHNVGNLPIVLGVGGNDTASVCQKIEYWTDKYDPAAFLSVSPYYNKPTQEGIFQHFELVCGATDTPIILYNVPGRTSSNMLPETVFRIAKACPNAVAIKDASGNLEQGMEMVANKPEGFSVLSGDDLLALPQMAIGFDGVISVSANAFPAEMSGLINAARAGDFATARQLHYQLLKVTQLLFAEGNPAGVKACLDLMGVIGPDVRLPLVEASESLRTRIQAEIEKISAKVKA
ncbi:MAG: 4-hydroxy-tetrahydrodipicolinate synthase, partial [Bacteroidota bacterium]